MRKLISILSVLLLMIGGNTASAQFAFKKLTAIGDPITEASQLEDGGYYVLQNFYKGKYLKIKADGSMVLGFEDAITPDDASDGLAVFKLHKVQNGSTTLYQFESAKKGYYIPTILMNHHATGEEIKGAVVSETPGTFELKTEATVDPNKEDDTPETKTGYFTIKNSSDDCYLDLSMGSDLLTGWYGRDDRAWFQLRKVTLDENPSTLQVLYKTVVKKEGTVFYTAYGLATTGETYRYTPPTEMSDNLEISDQPTDWNITAENNTFEYNYTKKDVNLFTPGQWYSLKIKDGDRLLRAVAEEGLYVNAESGSDLSVASNTYPNFLNALWRFEESGLGVKIYNKGTGKYLKTNGNGEDKANRVSFDDAGTVFIVKQKEGGIALYTAAGDGYLAACCSNAASNSSNTRLGVQLVEGSSESSASCIMLYGAEEDLLSVGKRAFADMSNALYVYTEDKVLKKGGHYSAYQSSAAAATTLADLLECGDKLGSEVNPEETAYYLIRNVSRGAVGTNDDMNKYLSSEYVFCDKEGNLLDQVGTVKNDRNVKRTKDGAALLPRLWKFERASEEGKYYLLNVNAGHYAAFVTVAKLGKFEFSLEKPQETNGVFYIHATDTKFNSDKKVINDNTTMFLMGINDVYVNAQNDMPAAKDDKGYSEVAGWNTQTDAGNYWQFIKVTEVPLTIKANDYTTLCLPFNVKLPENSTVKAYYASQAAGDVLKLTEITGGIIPANQGVILQNTNKSEVANINLTITPEETTTLTGNQLRGVTAKREGYTAKQNYVLAKGNKGIGFYKANFTAIPANKAYLPSENITNAQGVMMAFSFGNEVTGIDNVNTAAPAAKKYYDLQGRHVLYPAKGIFVTEDGQKVLFK